MFRKVENGYKFDVSIYDKISNAEFLDHINRVGKEIYKREQHIHNLVKDRVGLPSRRGEADQ